MRTFQEPDEPDVVNVVIEDSDWQPPPDPNLPMCGNPMCGCPTGAQMDDWIGGFKRWVQRW